MNFRKKADYSLIKTTFYSTKNEMKQLLTSQLTLITRRSMLRISVTSLFRINSSRSFVRHILSLSGSSSSNFATANNTIFLLLA